MYDPVLGRFVSADSIVPGSASGSMDGVALKPLTVDFHEPGFVSLLNGENRQPFWFQMNDEQRQKAGSPWGPANPQALNRYSYGLNNPVKYTDPTGHEPASPNCWPDGCGGVVYNNSNQTIVVFGDIYVPCADGSSGCTKSNVAIALRPGESSADYGFNDVDGIIIDGNRYFDVYNSEAATVSNDPDGRVRISSGTSTGIFTLPITMFGRLVILLRKGIFGPGREAVEGSRRVKPYDPRKLTYLSHEELRKLRER